MANIIAMIITAIVQILTPASQSSIEQLSPVRGEETHASQDVKQLFTREEIKEIAKNYITLLPAQDDPAYRETRHEIKKEIQADIAQIVEEKKDNEAPSIVPCVSTACKPTITPTPTFTPLPTITPKPTRPPRPTSTYAPTPLPTYIVIPIITPWLEAPTPCPSVPPYLLKDAVSSNKFIDPIICLD